MHDVLSQSLIIIIIVLHPRHKLSYFKNAGWEDEWVDTAETLVRDEFKRSYEHTIVNDDLTDDEDKGVGVSADETSMVCFFINFFASTDAIADQEHL